MKIYSSAEMAAIDKRAMTEYGIPGHVLMENAGRGLAALALEVLPRGLCVIVCGTGNNGGDGFAAARFLAEAGMEVKVFLSGLPGSLKPDARIHYEKLKTSEVPVQGLSDESAPEVFRREVKACAGIIDALFGSGLNRPLTPPWSDLVELMNGSGKPVVSADVPSGLNADTGEVMGVCVRAAATAVFGGMKRGLVQGQGPEHAGQIRLVDIGLPSELLT